MLGWLVLGSLVLVLVLVLVLGWLVLGSLVLVLGWRWIHDFWSVGTGFPGARLAAAERPVSDSRLWARGSGLAG
ncbi:hypothetical protein GCM10022222_14120 [Amycolatopsis ultiminotia]|uniref:Uncharacterized protein n=1 Tax=Amycolatopsis ultiminotia TaxID=543629 RepID=A0ABP6VDN9_9PSEU